MINQTHKIFLLFFSLVFVLLLSACTEGDRGFVPLAETPEEEKPADILVTGGGVKGPLINAEVNIYKLELDKGEIHEFNAALKKWYDLLEDNEVTVSGSTASAGSITESTVIDNFETSITQFGFVTELKKLKQDIKSATTFTEADDLVTTYLAPNETNEKVRKRVKELQDNSATLADYKLGLTEIESLTDELLATDSFSAARALLVDYRTNEQSAPNNNQKTPKQLGFDAAIADLDDYRSRANAFGLTAIRNAYETDIYDVFLPRFDIQNSPFTRQNIIELKELLADASSNEEAKTSLQKGFDKESNAQLKTALSQLIVRIVTLDDFKLDILGREALYHNYGIKAAIKLAKSSADSLQNFFVNINALFSDNLETALRNSFIVTKKNTKEADLDKITSKENLISFGITNEQGLLPGLKINQYRGFVYMEVKSIDKTIDLNSGRAPILSKLETIFHTDDIIGNGAENSEDRTVYFILNGVEQRDSNGKLITDRTLIETTGDDELLEVRPLFMASPLTQVGLDVAIEKMKTLIPFTSDSNLDGSADKFLSKNVLSTSLSDASDLVVEALGIGMNTELNIFRTPAIRVPEMKYSKDKELSAIQHRLSIENFAAFIEALRIKTNKNGSDLLALIAEDLVDNQLDAQAFSEQIDILASIPEYEFLLKSDPGEKFLPGTTTPVTDIFYVMNDELATTLPAHTLSGFSAKRNELITEAAKGGRDSDGDSILDNEDEFPEDPSLSRELNAGYPGIWSLVFDETVYGYMPFNEDFVFALNKQQIEGVCNNSPCIGLGNSSISVSAQYDLIQAPENHNFVLNAFNQPDAATLGFTAFATVPGNYLIKGTFTANTPTDIPVQTYEIIIPIQVIDPKSIEIKFDPEIPQPGKATRVQFKATKSLCALYSFCTEQNVDLDDNIPDYLDISYLSDIFSVNQTLLRDGVEINYSSVVSVSGNTGNDISNLDVNDQLNVIVKFKAGEREFTAKTVNSNTGGTVDTDADGAPDTLDVFPNDANCSLEKDGIQDSNLDGDINNLDTPTCFSTILAAADREEDVSFLNETWYYFPDRHYIVRKNKYQSGFNGLILVPTVQGTKQFIEHFQVDAIHKRVYFAYKNAAIDYFSLESQEIVEFAEGRNFVGINSLNMVGGFLLVEYDLGSNKIEAKLFNSAGQLAKIKGADEFPKPSSAVTLEIDGLNFLSATNNLLTINWQIERASATDPVPALTSNDKRTLLSGQTLFADVINLTFTFRTADNRDIQINEQLFVLNLDTIKFTDDIFNHNEALEIELEGFDSASLSESDQTLFVNWYKNDENTNAFEFISQDVKYPFILEESNFVYGDMIRAEIMLSHGSDTFLVKQLNAVILDDIRALIPLLDVDKTLINIETLDVSFTLDKPSANDEYFSLETFTPVWRINGLAIAGENGFTFPQLDSTKVRYGDSISVSYLIKINGLSVPSSELFITKLNIDPEHINFELLPKVAEIGQSISLDPSYFTEEELEKLVPFWFINGILDKSEKELTYPASKLTFGDHIKLLLASRGGKLEDAFSHIAEGSVGINLKSLENLTSDPINDLDSDQDGIPNHQDYFRNDSYCSVRTAGKPDDTDGDGLADLDELAIHSTSPSNADTDLDGLSDLTEINEIGTDPLVADTDGDGYLDGVEVELGTNPLNQNEPNILVEDNDYDGLSNDLELSNGTKVNVFDTDNDGLSDWYELFINTIDPNITLTDPLNPDSDGDGLSDGLERRTTNTDPNNPDDDGDGLPDGLEVILGLDPLKADSDDNGVADADEPGFDFSQQLSTILYISDLPNYDAVNDVRSAVPAGTCFDRFLADNQSFTATYSHQPQVSNLSEQQVAFSSPAWSEVLRFDALNKQYLQSVDLTDYTNTALHALEYDTADLDLIYLGFADGKVRRFDADTNQISDLFTAEDGLAVTKLIDQGVLLIAEQVDSNAQIIHTTYNKNTSVKSVWNSDYSYQNSVWADITRQDLLIVDPAHDASVFIRERFDSDQANPLVNSEVINSPSVLNGPIFIETIAGNDILRFGSGQSYNLTASAWLSQQLAPFSYGISHQSHRVVALKNSSILEMTTLSTLNGDQFWRFTSQLNQPELISVIPVGAHLLAITAKKATINQPSDISFQTIILGDADSNGLPDWWQRLSPSSTLTQFENYQLASDAAIPDFLNGDPDIDDSVSPPVLVDTDGDGVCDHWEVNLFGTDHLKADSDNDGASDLQELGIQIQNPLNCSVMPTFVIVSDPLNPDTDGDGLLDGEERFIHGTKPLVVDTDEDGLSDWQEIHVTNTNPLLADTNNIGKSDGEIDSDSDGLSDAEELNFYNTDPNAADSDGDGLSDFEEIYPNKPDLDGDGFRDDFNVKLYGSNPNKMDTDGDGLTDFEERNPDVSHLDPNIDRNGDDLINEEDTALYNAEVDKFRTNPAKRDTDGDGLTDDVEQNISGEYFFITYPTVIDSDGDGLTDAEEFNILYEYSEPELELFASLGITPSIRLNPTSMDTDGDKICDIWEVRLLSTNPAEDDTDFDDLNDDAELGITAQQNVDCSTPPVINPISDPVNRDTDGDGLLDGDEVTKTFTDPKDTDSNDSGITDDKEDFDGDGLTNYQEIYLTKTDPFNHDENENGRVDSLDDFDGDLLSNIFEITTSKTDPLNPDTNGNTIDDKEEYERGLSSSPDGDTDGDGISDFDELNNSVPTETDPLKRTDPLNPDSDFDGIEDGEELTIRTNPVNPDSDHDFLKDGDDNDGVLRPLDEDSDTDGIPDGIEVRFLRTSPKTSDSDGDGLADGDEAWVFAFAVEQAANPQDPPLLTNNLLLIGADKDIPLNSKAGVAGWSLPQPFAANGLDRLVFDLYDMSDATKIVAKLFIQRFSDPTKQDSDGDGLLDPTEFAIEAAYGNGFESVAFSELLSNADNFKVSDPWNIDSNSTKDTDGDGLPDWYEIKASLTDPLKEDSDDNGISDGQENPDADLLNNFQEMFFGSNPNVSDGASQIVGLPALDSDGDGLPDLYEIRVFNTSPSLVDTNGNGISDADEDSDNDGASNILELSLLTNPIVIDLGLDTDGDGLTDFQEIKLTLTDPALKDSNNNGIMDGDEDPDNDRASNLNEMRQGSDPFQNIDTDGDGLTDYQEIKITLTIPTLMDSDNNGIMDGDEDKDNDGVSNVDEVLQGSDPFSDLAAVDTDGDGLTDFQEIKLTLTDPTLKDSDNNGIMDGDEDPDNDRVSNLNELRQGSDPFENIDTDGDGLTDYQEINITNTDPLNANSLSATLTDAEFDSDADGLSNLSEVLMGLNPFLADAETLIRDSDGDGLLDHVELLITFTNPSTRDTNGNGIFDNEEDTDNDGLSNTLELTLGSDPIVRNYSLDTDGDGLTDFQELAITLTNPNLLDSSSNGILDSNDDFDGDSLTNLQEMQLLNDPYVADILDSHEDADGDLLINILDQNNQETDVLNSDTDGDGILDGVEVLILQTNPGLADTDGDGITDFDELVQFDQSNIREVAGNEACTETETRISAVAGKDYCISVSFNSYPTLSDSDNDGTPDRVVNQDSSITLDHFPLDASCSASTDGFENPLIGREQCFSSWMSGFASMDIITSAEWLSSISEQYAEVIFYNQGWDKVIRYNILTSSYLTQVSVDVDETVVAIASVGQTRSLFLFYSNGRLDRFDLETAVTQTIANLAEPGLSPSSLLALANGDLILQYKDGGNLSSLYLYDQNGQLLDTLSNLQVDLAGGQFKCETVNCNTAGYVYAFEEDASGSNTNLARVEINLQSRTFNPLITSANTLAQFSELKGPIRLSQAGDKVYLGSGQILEDDLQGSDHSEDLSIEHLGKTYTEFFDFAESNDHFVGIIDYDISSMPSAPLQPATQNGLIVKDLSAIQINTNKYLLPPVALEERILGLFPYESLEMAVVSKLNDRILIENLGVSDQDGDGMPGIYEKFYGLDDNDFSDKFTDPDLDALANIEEYIYASDPWSDKFGDADNDGLTNIEEFSYGTDPLNKDTDGDDVEDLQEILDDTNPLDPLDF